MAAMEEAVASPDVAITSNYLGTPIDLMKLTRFGPTPTYTLRTPEEIQRWIQEVVTPYQEKTKPVEDEAIRQLADAIPHKRGEALATSQLTLFNRRPRPPGAAAPKELLANFTLLPENSQFLLLTWNWHRFGSPEAETLVRSLAESGSPLRDMALERLWDLNPEAARRITLDRIRRADVSREAYHDDRVPLQLPDKTLPELDDALAGALQQGRYGADWLFARYASEAAYTTAAAIPVGRLCGSPVMGAHPGRD